MEISEQYLQQFIKPRGELMLEMERFAEAHHIPIMQLSSVQVLSQLLRIQHPTTILEIGTAIGYSALHMALTLPNSRIVTVERDEGRVQKAKEYIARSEVANQITILEGDALEVDVTTVQATYDAVFIDAAKGQYQKFFEKFAPLVSIGGILYIDNLYMHGLSNLPMEEVPRRKRTMIRNIRQFTEWIMKHPDYESAFFPVGDGLLICLKR